MRSIILNTNKFAAEVVEKSKYPEGISPEKRNTQSEQMENCLVVLFWLRMETEKSKLMKYI